MPNEPHDSDPVDDEAPEGRRNASGDAADRSAADHRPANPHPTGEKQAAENAENEPAA